MTDDIVTRLREHHCCDNMDCRQAELAADEIERVRKQRDELAWAIYWYLQGGSWDKLEKRFKAYEAQL